MTMTLDVDPGPTITEPIVILTRDQLVEGLEKTLAYFDDGKKWCQGFMYSRNHRTMEIRSACSVGAINIISKAMFLYSDDRHDSALQIRFFIENMIWEEFHVELPVWNDALERTFDDVKEMFQRAIIKARSMS